MLTFKLGSIEQQFQLTVSNIAAMRYLKAMGKLTADYLQASDRFLSTGYQQLLSRRRPDGSYSQWGDVGEASVYMRVLVAKILGHVKEVIKIDDNYIVEALGYISARQKDDGSFVDDDQTYHVKTKTQQDVPFTAFCAIAFLENVDYNMKYKTTIEKALTNIKSLSAQPPDNFALAIGAYALALNSDPAAEQFLDELMKNAIVRVDKMFWNREGKSFSNKKSSSVNVEIAAYALMTLVKLNRSAEALPILNWLMTQRTSTGGFHSSTAVGLQALEMIATVLHTPNVNMEVKLSSEKEGQAIFNINSNNAIVLQSKELEKDTRFIRVSAKGSGFAFLQVSYKYNTILNDPAKHLKLTATPVAPENPNLLSLKICTHFIPDGEIVQSQMTLIEVFLPSGYVYDPQTFELVKLAGVKVKFELRF